MGLEDSGWTRHAALAAALALLGGCVETEPSRSAVSPGMDGLCILSDAESRSISPENPDGSPAGGARAMPAEGSHGYAHGLGWKARPCQLLKGGEIRDLMDVEGEGAIQSIWITLADSGSLERRTCVIRMYWDDEAEPSVECPLGDFFANGFRQWAPLSSQAVCVGPRQAYSCFWPMPFRRRARISLENRGEKRVAVFFQINYSLGRVPDDAAYFHAQFRRSNPTEGSVHTILDGVRGRGHYVGTYFAWRCRNDIWWGEGEVKFYIDGDTDFPTICGTGTEDYVLGSHNFEVVGRKKFWTYNTPYAGLIQAEEAKEKDGISAFGMYRWHIADPVRFREGLRVTVQDLGWAPGPYVKQSSDVATTAFWYQTEPHAPFPALPSNALLDEDCNSERVSRGNRRPGGDARGKETGE